MHVSYEGPDLWFYKVNPNNPNNPKSTHNLWIQLELAVEDLIRGLSNKERDAYYRSEWHYSR